MPQKEIRKQQKEQDPKEVTTEHQNAEMGQSRAQPAHVRDLGAPFLRDNGININFRTSTLSTESPNPEPPEPQIIQPRSETLIPVLTDKEDGTTLIIHAQNIGEKGIVSGNIVNHVKDGQILVSLIIGDAFPIPRIDEILDQLGRSRYYTTLDLASGYHQVPIRPQDCERYGISTDKGSLRVCPNALRTMWCPARFQRLMNNVLTGLNGMKAFVYLDDIIIHAVDLMEHETRLEEVFQRFAEIQPTASTEQMSMSLDAKSSTSDI
ncbi:uncharacterized protein LOC113558052 [Rhopalosiphum maidis]|uniref:uncharacterized protein LOC113558052 n=1 Tax=Rhopalosiphum maidis TaxID=43146 RepID=UPI000F00F891|nr:uncharacterized protein LOC113558052 [Rhopalosiphum maidis]